MSTASSSQDTTRSQIVTPTDSLHSVGSRSGPTRVPRVYADALLHSKYKLTLLDPARPLPRRISEQANIAARRIMRKPKDEIGYNDDIVRFFKLLVPDLRFDVNGVEFALEKVGSECDLSYTIVEDGQTWTETTAYLEHRSWQVEGHELQVRKSKTANSDSDEPNIKDYTAEISKGKAKGKATAKDNAETASTKKDFAGPSKRKATEQGDNPKKSIRINPHFGCVAPDIFGYISNLLVPPSIATEFAVHHRDEPATSGQALQIPAVGATSSLSSSFIEAKASPQAIDMEKSSSFPLPSSPQNPSIIGRDATVHASARASGSKAATSKPGTLLHKVQKGYLMCPYITGEIKPLPEQVNHGLGRQFCYSHAAFLLSGCFIGFAIIKLRMSRILTLDERTLVVETLDEKLHGKLDTVPEALAHADGYRLMGHSLGSTSSVDEAGWLELWNTAAYAASLVATLPLNRRINRIEAPRSQDVPTWSKLREMVNAARTRLLSATSPMTIIDFGSTKNRMSAAALAGKEKRDKDVDRLFKYLNLNDAWDSRGERLSSSVVGEAEGASGEAVGSMLNESDLNAGPSRGVRSSRGAATAKPVRSRKKPLNESAPVAAPSRGVRGRRVKASTKPVQRTQKSVNEPAFIDGPSRSTRARRGDIEIVMGNEQPLRLRGGAGSQISEGGSDYTDDASTSSWSSPSGSPVTDMPLTALPTHSMSDLSSFESDSQWTDVISLSSEQEGGGEDFDSDFDTTTSYEDDDPIVREYQELREGISLLVDLDVRIYWVHPDVMTSAIKDGVQGVLSHRAQQADLEAGVGERSSPTGDEDEEMPQF